MILQGPPGTGKTRLAKQLAALLTAGELSGKSRPSTITDDDIRHYIKAGETIQSVAGNAGYYVEAVEVDRIRSTKVNGTPDNTLFRNIRQAYSENNWNNGIEGNDQRRAAAFAKVIFNRIGNDSRATLLPSEQFRMIQFHPSYTYEDFVRGIVATPEPDGNGMRYEAQGKLLMQFAETALKNWEDSHKETETLSYEIWVSEQFKDFIEEIEIKLERDGKVDLTEAVKITAIEEDALRYRGQTGWSALGNRMQYRDLIRAYLDGAQVRLDVRHNSNLSGLANWHASYYIRVVDMFRNFLKSNNRNYVAGNTLAVELRNYVLVIDEINRANLSSVLGELVYALEYRGETVQGLYAALGKSQIVLPPNLYIIGTMNTADRSVGHIDYAVRRRFAFVELLPSNLTEVPFEGEMFRLVSSLFVQDITDNEIRPAEYMSPEFRPQDVWLGHSYFIKKEDATPEMRFRYEILPILEEYIKDGILKETSRQVIAELKDKYFA